VTEPFREKALASATSARAKMPVIKAKLKVLVIIMILDQIVCRRFLRYQRR